MYYIEKRFSFEAAHTLPDHNGKCKNMHGHSYKCLIILKSPTLKTEGSERGMVCDFGKLSEFVDYALIHSLDHTYLNDSIPLENPTAENIAKWIYDLLKHVFPETCGVEIQETENCKAAYMEV